MSDFKKHYPQACEVVVPISLKIPVCLDVDVIGQKPSCYVNNGYEYPVQKDEKGLTGDGLELASVEEN